MLDLFIKAFGGQSALAEALGCSQSLISKWMKGGDIPDKWGERFIQLAKLKNIEINEEEILSYIRPANINKNNKVSVVLEPNVRSSNNLSLPFSNTIVTQQEIDGIGMGVLSDGTPFLNIAGLARLCGVDEKTIRNIRDMWGLTTSSRTVRIKEMLQDRGAETHSFCLEIPLRSTIQYACTDVISMAVLEYYAFEAGTIGQPIAQKNYRLLANLGLKSFIYNQVGYDPQNKLPVSWQIFRDRVSLVYNAVPLGYFCVFKEVSDIIVAIISAGGEIDSRFVPDISIGLSWSKYWKDNALSEKYGHPAQYPHNYPTYFPQSASNPQPSKCYPEEALGEFRKWMREVYLKQGKFKNYLSKKESKGELPPSFAQLAVDSYSQSLGIKDQTTSG